MALFLIPWQREKQTNQEKTTPSLVAWTKTKSTLRKQEAGLQLSESATSCIWLHIFRDNSTARSTFC